MKKASDLHMYAHTKQPHRQVAHPKCSTFMSSARDPYHDEQAGGGRRLDGSIAAMEAMLEKMQSGEKSKRKGRKEHQGEQEEQEEDHGRAVKVPVYGWSEMNQLIQLVNDFVAEIEEYPAMPLK